MATCKKCNRAVHSTDVDKSGLCVFCAPAPPAPADKKAKDEDK